MSKEKQRNNFDTALDWRKIYEELNDADDRAAAIVGEAILDDCLLTLLSNYFVDSREEVNRLLSHRGPFSSLYGKSILAYCLGLITRGQLDDLMAINEIRNRFAHKLHGSSFEDQLIKDKMSRIEHYKRFLSSDQANLSRKQFNAAVGILAYALSIESVSVVHCQEKKAPNISELLEQAGADIFGDPGAA